MKIVRCVVRNLTTQKQQIRFIPLSEYKLWEHLLKERHRIEVIKKQTMLWISKEEYSMNKGIYSKMSKENVIKITLYLFSKEEEEEMLIPVIRFLSEEEYPKIKPIFLSHYQGQNIERIIEEEGYCISK